MMSGSCRCQRVHVMLAVQARQALDPFLDTLKEVTDDDMDGRCSVTVFVDNEPGLIIDDLEGEDALQYHVSCPHIPCATFLDNLFIHHVSFYFGHEHRECRSNWVD